MKYAFIAAALFGAASLAPALAHNHGEMNHEDHCAGMPMGEGVVNAVNVKKSQINISHGPIKAIGWGEMTMDFSAAKKIDLSGFAAGEKVHFLLEEKKKKWTIAAICSMDVEDGAHEACMQSMHKAAMKIAEKSGAPMCKMHGKEHGAGHEGRGAKSEAGHEGHH